MLCWPGWEFDNGNSWDFSNMVGNLSLYIWDFYLGCKYLYKGTWDLSRVRVKVNFVDLNRVRVNPGNCSAYTWNFSSLVGNFYKCIEHLLYIRSKNYWVKCLSTYVQQYMHYKLTSGDSSVISFNIHSHKLGVLDICIKAWVVDFSRVRNFYWQSTPMLAIKIFPLTLEFSMVNISPTLICRFFQGHWKFLPTKYSKDWAVDFSSLVGKFLQMHWAFSLYNKQKLLSQMSLHICTAIYAL